MFCSVFFFCNFWGFLLRWVFFEGKSRHFLDDLLLPIFSGSLFFRGWRYEKIASLTTEHTFYVQRCQETEFDWVRSSPFSSTKTKYSSKSRINVFQMCGDACICFTLSGSCFIMSAGAHDVRCWASVLLLSPYLTPSWFFWVAWVECIFCSILMRYGN